MENKSNGKAIAALVMGILGLVGGWIPVVCYFTGVLSILAIIFGFKERKSGKEAGTPTGMATAGMVMGIIAVGITVLSIICTAIICGGAAASLSSLADYAY